MGINNNLSSEYRLLSANPAYWEVDMSLVDLKKAAAVVKSALQYGIIAEVPVVTRAGQDGYKSKFKCQHGHTVLYAATKLYKLGESLEGQAKIDHYQRFEHLMCLLLNDEVRPGVPAFAEVQSDEWIAGLLKPYQA
jgi:hypothetical protein